jgi:hypothetical protein
LTNDIRHATGVFATYSWPSGKLLENCGDSEIKVFATHFSKHLEIEEDNTDDVLSEWYEFKVPGKGLSLNELLEKSLTERTISNFRKAPQYSSNNSFVDLIM